VQDAHRWIFVTPDERTLHQLSALPVAKGEISTSYDELTGRFGGSLIFPQLLQFVLESWLQIADREPLIPWLPILWHEPLKNRWYLSRTECDENGGLRRSRSNDIQIAFQRIVPAYPQNSQQRKCFFG
jgi:hypothetical protein